MMSAKVYGAHSEAETPGKEVVCSPGLAHMRLTSRDRDQLLFDAVMWAGNAKCGHFDFMPNISGRGVEEPERRNPLAVPKARDWILDQRIDDRNAGMVFPGIVDRSVAQCGMMKATLACMFLVAALPGLASAQSRDVGQDAEIQQLRQTIERLTARVQALEAGNAAAALAAPAPVPSAPVSSGSPPSVSTPAAPEAALATTLQTVPSPLPIHETFDEDEQAVARADNAVPPGDTLEGFFLVPGTRTWLRMSGYAKLDAMFDSGNAGDSDQFITSDIPVDAGRDGSRFNMHARQTRFTVEARRETDAGQLRFLLQNDFFGSDGSYGYRLRHAYGQLGNTYAGFGWSAFMDLDSSPDTLDFAGVGASPLARLASIRQYFPLGRGNQIVLAAEHRAPELHLNDDARQTRTAAPNLVVAARHEARWGSVQLAGLLRYLAYDSARDSGGGSDETMAGGVALSGAWGGDSGDYVVFGAVAGQGIAAYIGDLGGLDLDGVVDERGRLQALRQQGGWVGYTHRWTQNWRSTLTYGRLYLERDSLLDPAAFRRSDYAAANLIWQPAPSWSWGAEVLYGKRQQQDGADGDVLRVQTSLKYDFIK